MDCSSECSSISRDDDCCDDDSEWHIDFFLPRRRKEVPLVHIIFMVILGAVTITVATAVALNISISSTLVNQDPVNMNRPFYQDHYGDCAMSLNQASMLFHNKTMKKLHFTMKPISSPDWRTTYYFHIEILFPLSVIGEAKEDQVVVFSVRNSDPTAIIINQKTNGPTESIVLALSKEYGRKVTVNVFSEAQLFNYMLVLSFHYEYFNILWTSVYRFSSAIATFTRNSNGKTEISSLLGQLQRHRLRKTIDVEVSWLNMKLASAPSLDRCFTIAKNATHQQRLVPYET